MARASSARVSAAASRLSLGRQSWARRSATSMRLVRVRRGSVLDGASLELRRGEIVALTGPNGIGKTTLAKLVAGLLEPDYGPGRDGSAASRTSRRIRAGTWSASASRRKWRSPSAAI